MRGADDAEPWWFETGHDWGDGAAYPHGIESRFRAAGLERVFGSLGAFIEAAQWQQYRALKYQIETIRAQPALAGYVITEFTDCLWESNGLLDMRRNPRVFHDAFAGHQCRDCHRAELGSGRLLGGRARPRRARGRAWRGRAGLGRYAPLAAQRGGRAKSGPSTWSMACGICRPPYSRRPRSKAPPPTAWSLSWSRTIGRWPPIILSLQYCPAARRRPPSDFQVWASGEIANRIQALGYRLAPSLLEADAVVALALDESLCAAIRGGARVVLLADQPMELQPIFPHWQATRVVRRSGTMWQGDWISSFSWLRRDGPFARMPGRALVDHAFDRVIPNHVIAGCSTWDFQARVHAGMVIGWVHKPAGLIVERERGRGKMVVTTFRLLEDAPGADPVATALLDGAARARHDVAAREADRGVGRFLLSYAGPAGLAGTLGLVVTP